jgi:hypothetical protein
MKPVILFDISGVLNPSVCPGSGGDRPVLLLSNEKRALDRRLARSGRIAWVSTWPADMVAGLEAQPGLDAEPLRVTMAFRPADADWDSVVWIDDVLGTDARCLMSSRRTVVSTTATRRRTGTIAWILLVLASMLLIGYGMWHAG